MSDPRIDGYARALFEVAAAEGTIDEVEDELFRFARSFESSDALRTALTDEQIPVAKRQAIIEDLLGGKATTTTTQLVSMVVGSGRGRDLPAIIDQLVARASSAKHLEVAEVDRARVARRARELGAAAKAGRLGERKALRLGAANGDLKDRVNSVLLPDAAERVERVAVRADAVDLRGRKPRVRIIGGCKAAA
jgi:F-type H+-transporting ATPase subunit delta